MWLSILIGIFVICFGLVVLRGAPYVPTHRAQLRAAFDKLYPLGEQDVLVDLGSGDGVVLREARRHGARAVGYELNPLLVAIARLKSLTDRGVQVRLRDYLLVDTLPPDTTVVYAFTTSHSIEPIGRKLRQWSRRRECYFISYGFTLADERPIKHVGPMYLYRFAPGKK